MIVTQPGAALAVQLLPQCAFLIFFLHQPAPLQDGHDTVDEVSEGTRGNGVREIKPVYSGFDPLSEGVAICSGVPTKTGPAPPMPTYLARSRSVHVLVGSASVKPCTMVRIALVSMNSSGRSGSN
jgi:hypothetical protein